VEFSKAQFESLLAEISAGIDDLSSRLEQIEPAAVAAADRWYVPDTVADAIIWLGRETVAVGRKILNFLKDLLKGATAPIFMFMDAWAWMDVRGSASNIASSLSEQHLVVDNSDWSGKARDAYVSSAASQREAASRISTIASNTSDCLLYCALAGTAFYTSLALVLAKLVAAAIAAVAAFGSAVFSWAGAAILLEEAGINTAIITTAVGALTGFLGAQAYAMVKLHGEAVDNSTFPGGRWPSADSSTYSDATVKDGDADWSLAPS